MQPVVASPPPPGHWSLDDIDWRAFDAAKVTPAMLSVAKAACLVEHNSDDYARYLCKVFKGDAAFEQAVLLWAKEEVQHGQALRKWAELADPSFDFDESFRQFTTGYQLPLDAEQSVRGSRWGELIARCVVEAGTSSYYSAIRDRTDEPVLKAIAARIAADEFRHYKLFYTHLNRYLAQEKTSFWKRLRVALGRIAESEDDELAYAFYAAHRHPDQAAYDRKIYAGRYLAHACSLYRKPHIERMTAMIFKAAGLKPHGAINRAANALAWHFMQWRGYRLRRYANAVA